MGSKAKVKTMLSYVGCRIRVVTINQKELIGRLLSYDKHANLILEDTERVTVTRSKKIVREQLGLIMLRGTQILSISYKPSVTTAPLQPQADAGNNSNNIKGISLTDVDAGSKALKGLQR
eukprot:Tbor_TRINITY_DN6174_c1_g2::TRINITY_DN6174_c1_g2_i1::g.21404::m.21404/K11086/SNRPB, SMB; small nuclear ribonucleoprotein B and B'